MQTFREKNAEKSDFSSFWSFLRVMLYINVCLSIDFSEKNCKFVAIFIEYGKIDAICVATSVVAVGRNEDG